ncbi:MAG TPA: exodeoxyribonuclease VII small subunit [Burkholderiales bacterium]|nr:exodeoxyribonuclease VII small subunit [Pseudomonadota bacterium]HVC49187.1 exodeoxyribonuclease VII small subunit [Burkholderiales bacterium]
MNEKTALFNENYAKLREIAEAMKNQREPDIDGLVKQVSDATQAYKICSERLDAVSKLIDEMLGHEDRPA